MYLNINLVTSVTIVTALIFGYLLDNQHCNKCNRKNGKSIIFFSFKKIITNLSLLHCYIVTTICNYLFFNKIE